jgi:hypothetical protein
VTRLHPWEKKGLGVAPFQFVRLEKVPRNASARCAYCNKAIQWLSWVRGQNGPEFKVGSECIKNAEFWGSSLRSEAEAAIKQARESEGWRRVASAKAFLVSNPDFLADKPSPYGDNRTLREWADFALEHGGLKKQLQVSRVVEANIMPQSN